MVVIVDYGMGNLKSVESAFNKLDIPCKVSRGIEDIENAAGIVLPGVGAFKDAMDNLDALGYVDKIKDKASAGIPILGICLGMQMFFQDGYEIEKRKGFGFFQGDVKLMEPSEKVKIPHIGWNRLEFTRKLDLTNSLSQESFVYFVHSYCGQNINEEDLVAYAEYGGIKIPAIIAKKNIIGMQFHPEKSGHVGLEILKAFGEMVK